VRGGGGMTKANFLTIRPIMTNKRYVDGDRKSEVYTKGSDDRLANFRSQAVRLKLTEFMVWNVYASKHWDAVQAYLVDGTEGPEGIESNIQDVQNYCDLLLAMVFDKKSIDSNTNPV
jgi:hypothetical protein